MQRRIPVWSMGLANASFGMYLGFVAISLPQLLAARGEPEAQVAAMTAAVFSPLFWSFVAGPMLDVRFSRRTYALVLAVLAAVALAVGVDQLDHPALMVTALMTGVALINLSSNALFGWLASVLPREDETRVSSWANAANIGGSGAMVVLAGELLQRLSRPVAATLLALVLLLPTLLYPWIEAPGPDRRLARESFAAFFREVLQLVRQRRIVLPMVIFALPSASFALANVVGGLGAVYRTSEHTVSLVGGLGIVLAGVVGSLGYPPLTRLLPLRPLYLAIGVVGAGFTLLLLAAPLSPAGFIAATVGENLFQALAITGAYAIQFESVGPENPLAATSFSVMNAALNVSTTYMIWLDGRAFARGGVRALFGTDASCGLVACGLLAAMLAAIERRSAARAASSTEKSVG